MRFKISTLHVSFSRKFLEDILHLSKKVNPERKRQRAQDMLYLTWKSKKKVLAKVEGSSEGGGAVCHKLRDEPVQIHTGGQRSPEGISLLLHFFFSYT